MKYQRIEATFDQIKVLLNQEGIEWLELNRRNISNLYLYGAIEGNTLVGYAVYMVYEAFSSMCILVYVEVKEDLRRNYIGSTLMKESARDLKKLGYKQIKASVSPGDDAFESLLTMVDFKSICKSEIVTYKMADIADSPAIREMPEIEKGFKFIKSFMEFDSDDKRLVEFADWLEEFRPGINLDKLNKEYTCFFEYEGKIYGYTAIQRLKQNYIVMRDIVVMPVKNGQFAPVVMLAYSMKHMFEDMPEDTTITSVFYDRQYVPTLEKMFGQPDDCILYHDYLYTHK